MFTSQVPLLVIALALGASATPIDPITTTYSSTSNVSSKSNQVTVTGKTEGANTGTIFRFGDPAAARKIFWESGSCGLSTYFADKVDGNIPLVAFPESVMKQHGASQNNKLCGKVATLKSKGKTMKVVVADTNVSPEHSIDMTSDVWTFFGQKDGDGSHKDFQIQWSIDM